MSTPDIPEKSWENPFAEETFLHELFGKILSQNRDFVGVVSDARGRRGTGKTVASMKLAAAMDQTDEGLTADKCMMQPEELRNAYDSQPNRSGLVLDEGEVGIDNRSAMTHTNKAIREVVSMARVREKYLWINVPIKSFIDKDILKLCDVWLKIERKGRGLVHHLKWEPYSETLYTEKKQRIEFGDIPRGTRLRRIYNGLTREKNAHIDGEKGESYIRKAKHKEVVKKAVKEAKKEKRDDLIASFFNHPEVREAGIPQRVVAEAADVSQGHVSNVANSR